MMKTKYMNLSILVVLVLCVGLVMPASATPTVINFDNLADSEVLTNQYAGVVFSDAIIRTWPEYHSASNIAYSETGRLQIVFDNPVSRVKFWYGNFQNAWFEAYDINNNLLSTVNVPITQSGNFFVDSVEIVRSSNDIKYVIYHDGGAQIGMDDLEYETVDTSIPEFPTVALPVIAVIGLMFLFQRRKA